MKGEFKQCPRNHYYQGSFCPYCKDDNVNPSFASTILYDESFAGSSSTAPTVIEGAKRDFDAHKAKQEKELQIDEKSAEPRNTYSQTVFGDESATSVKAKRSGDTPSYKRKLVGWLVSFTLNDYGVDFKLYEGRNIIGRNPECNIVINDGRVSDRHAILLYRSGKFSIADSQSSHGTFVNDEDIELSPRYINDGDIIRMGNTICRFKSAL